MDGETSSDAVNSDTSKTLVVSESVAKEEFATKLSRHFMNLRKRGLSPNEACSLALKIAAGAVDSPADLATILGLLKVGEDTGSYQVAVEQLGAAFSSLDALNCLFLKTTPAGAREDEVAAQDQPSALLGIDFAAVEDFYAAIEKLDNDVVMDTLMKATDLLLSELLHLVEGGGDARGYGTFVRPLLVVWQNPFLMEPVHHDIFTKLCRVISSLSADVQATMVLAFQSFTTKQMESLIEVVQQFITIHLYDSLQIDDAVEAATVALSFLYKANTKSRVVSLSAFYNDAVNNEDFNIREDYRRWKDTEGSFNFCKYPFIYDPASKSRILQLDSNKEMASAFNDALYHSMFIGTGPSCPFLILRVRRNNIINDTIAQVQRRVEDLKKPLKVQFLGEDGVDEGGVQKEFFQLVVREIFDAKYGMFSYDEETRLFWFSKTPLELDSEYDLVGKVLGLAIYNGHILEFRVPSVIYKKLLGKESTFEDLEEVSPGLAKGLRDLLKFEGDVQEVYCRSFQVSVRDCFDEVSTVDLKEGGADIPVTSENRQEYVDLCVKYYLDLSIEQPFRSFAGGFQKLCGGQVLQLFQPEELEQLICGSPVLDFEALEKATVYEDGFNKDSQVIKWFWEIVHSLPEEQQKRLLFFTTGSDRVPIKGLANLPFLISKNGADSARLPTAHTCFNHLLLPEYSSKEKLRHMLTTAISNAEGFGLM